MEYIILITISILIIIVLTLVIEIKIKNIKEIGENKKLNEIVKKFPNNIDVCKEILKKLGNDTTKVKETIDKNAKSSLYIIATDSIIIANIKDSFTRIQTIAHECIHSIQNKKIVWFNFVFTNIFLIYYITTIVLTIMGIYTNYLLQISILLLLSSVQFMIRSFIENEAMIKAKYVAKEYMESNNLEKQEIIDEIINEYDKLNDLGIKLVNLKLFVSNLFKIIIYMAIALIKTV